MKVRVITAIIGIIAVLGLVYLGGWFLTGAIFLVSLLALRRIDLSEIDVCCDGRHGTCFGILLSEGFSGCDFSCLCTASLLDSGH